MEEHQAGVLNINKTWNGAVAILAVAGVIDMFTVPQFKAALSAAIAGKPTSLIVDLSDIEFLSSAGMSALVWIHNQADEAGIGFGVAADSPSTSRVIRLVGLAHALNLHPTVEETAASLNGTAE